MPYTFLGSSVKCQGHTKRKIDKLAPIWAFPVDNSNLNSVMALITHIASRSMEEVPYRISGSSVKFQGQMNWTINLDLIQARLQSRSRLSNPSDLPCCQEVVKEIEPILKFHMALIDPHVILWIVYVLQLGELYAMDSYENFVICILYYVLSFCSVGL